MTEAAELGAMRCSAALPFALALLLAALPACESTRTDLVGGSVSEKTVQRFQTEPGLRGDGFPAPNRQVVWEAVARVLREMRYIPNSEDSAPESGVVVTRWRSSLSTFSRDGFRERATVRVLPVPGRSGYWHTEANVIRQQNNNISDPGNPLSAEWATPQRQSNIERLINQRVEQFFLPNRVSDTFRRQHNMPDAGSSPRVRDLPQPEPRDDSWDWVR